MTENTYRVVVTGIGPVTSAGIGKHVFQQSVWAARNLAQRIPETWAARLKTKWYVPLPDFELAAFGASFPHESVLQPGDRMAVLAARLALEDAGFSSQLTADRSRTDPLLTAGVLLGVGLGGMQTAFDSYLAHQFPAETLEAAFPGHRPLFGRMVVPKTMTNAPAAWVSICFGLTGACTTLNASCASGTYAIGEAFRRIRHGYDRILLAGGVESLQDSSGFMLRGFDALGVLTQSTDGRPQPFSERRTGFLFAEGGACILVLEELRHALNRGAHIYAEAIDYQANSDAKSILQMDTEGTQVKALLTALCRDRTIDYLNAHGTGTLANDSIESAAIREMFGGAATVAEPRPLINSTKGILGHTLGASGAIEAAVTALSIDGDTVHPNATTEPMEGLNLPVLPVSTPVRNAVTVSYGFGGHNAGLLFSKYEGER